MGDEGEEMARKGYAMMDFNKDNVFLKCAVQVKKGKYKLT